MKIKILKDEYLFSEQGTHVCDEHGFAIKASENVECEVNEEHAERVKALLKENRLNAGLDEEGNLIPAPEPIAPIEEPVVIEQPVAPVEE